MRKALFILLAVLLVAGSVPMPASATVDKPAQKLGYLDKLPPLIDREKFFGDPEIASGQISPDGKFISFRKPYKDVMNIWIKEFNEPFEAARPVTSDTTRPVLGYGWTWDGKYILYIQDKGGDENYHLYRVDPRERLRPGQDVPEAVDMTPIEGIRAAFYSFPKNTPDIIYIGLNDRDERYHDVYRLDLTTGNRTLVMQNDEGMVGWVFDLEGNLRIAVKETTDGGTEFFRIDGTDFVSVYLCSNEEQANIIQFHKDGKRVWMDTNKGEDIDLSRLILFNPETLEEEFIESDPKKEVDFGGALFSVATDELVGTYYVGDRLRLYWKDKQYEKDYKKLKKKLPEGDLYNTSATINDRIWLISVTSDTDPGATYVFDRDKNSIDFLYRPRPELPVEHLAEMKPVKYKARDGFTIHGYLTVPKGVKAKNLPVVVHPHGGPWYRDSWGYNPYVQFLANRGYAVFQPNFRSSTGYGKKFFNAGKRQWGDAMQDDITDGVRYLVDEGIADPATVSIFGGSYGGYATLAGMAFTPDLYKCGVDYVGVSNLITFLKSIPPYWETLRNYLTEQVGDPDNPEDVKRLERQSPLFSADKIEAPLLVVQGANDPRVKKAESDQIVIAMRDLGRDVEYIIAPDEGHGFAGEENRIVFTVAMEKFFSKHLGGRFQDEVPGDIAERLASMTVDVSTVTTEKPEVDPEVAMKAPLPACDGSRIKPMTMKYKANVSVMGQEIPVDVTVKNEKTAVGEKPVWRITSTQDSPMGSAVETFDVDQKTLLPVKQSMSGAVTYDVNYSPDAINGLIKAPGRDIPIDLKLEAPVFGGGTALDAAITSLPLTKGYKTTLRTFEFVSQKVRPMSLTVTGVENVTVPAGSYEVYKLELKPLDGEPGGGTYFVSENEPRLIVRSTSQMPAQQGGGTVTTELESFK